MRRKDIILLIVDIILWVIVIYALLNIMDGVKAIVKVVSEFSLR